MRRLLCVLVISGCEAEPDAVAADAQADAAPDGARPDLEVVDAVMDAGRSCTLMAPPRLVVKAGGRLEVPFEGPVESVQATLPGGRAEVGEGTVRVRVGYEAGETTLTLEAVCADGALAQAEITLEIEPLQWEALPGWTPADDGPLAREYFSWWIDPLDADRLWLFGGFHYEPRQFTVAWDLWSYDITRKQWTEERFAGPAPHLAGGGIAPIAGASAAFYYGGLGVTAAGGSDLPFSLARLDHGELPTWRAIEVEDAPADGTYQPAFFHDSGRGVWLAIGGQGAERTHMDIHAFDAEANTWSPVAVAPGPAPSGRTGFFWTLDPETRRFIAFAGEQGGQAEGCNCAQDTWALELDEDPPRWVRLLDTQDPPLGRRNGAYALDPIGHRLLIWGGTADGRSAFPGVYALDLDRGHEAWTKVETLRPPPDRASGGFVFDGARGRLLGGFGNGARVYADLWSLSLRP